MRRSSWVRCAAVTLLAAVIVFGAAPLAFAERTIALSTGTIELALAPGGEASESLKVANNGDEPIKALVYTNDVRYAADGAPEYVKPTGAAGEYNKSPASWLTLRMPAETQVVANTPYIELEPGEELQIDFQLRVPGQATPGDYNAIIFFEMFDDVTPEGTTSQVSGRIGARIVLRVEGDIVDKLDVAPFSVRGLVIGDTVPYGFTVSNEGNIDKRMVTSLIVLDGSEAERMRSVVESEAIVYASSKRDYSGGLALDGVSFGKYTLRVELAYEKETGTAPGATVPEIVVKDRTFWVFPLWFVILLILAIGLPVLWFSWRSARKSGRRPRHRDEESADVDERERPARTRTSADSRSRSGGHARRGASVEAEERAARRREAAERLRNVDDEPAPRPLRESGETPREAAPPLDRPIARVTGPDDDWSADLFEDDAE